MANKIVCVSCLAENDEQIEFCQSCGSPLGTTSTLDPMSAIQAEGFLFRKTTEGRPKFIVVFGLWLMFFSGIGGWSLDYFCRNLLWKWLQRCRHILDRSRISLFVVLDFVSDY
jgi:hypothetical protein